jgi:hypothetical protein
MNAGEGQTAEVRVGVTGHRRLGDDPRTAWYVYAECVLVLDRLRDLARYRGAKLVAYSALAIGADTLFAHAALGLGIPLVGAVPFAGYAAELADDDRRQFEHLLTLCTHVEWLPARERSDQAYLKVGQWIVERVDYVVAVWNGQPAAGVGGTGDIVAYARAGGKPVLHIDPAALPAVARAS